MSIASDVLRASQNVDGSILTDAQVPEQLERTKHSLSRSNFSANSPSTASRARKLASKFIATAAKNQIVAPTTRLAVTIHQGVWLGNIEGPPTRLVGEQMRWFSTHGFRWPCWGHRQVRCNQTGDTLVKSTVRSHSYSKAVSFSSSTSA